MSLIKRVAQIARQSVKSYVSANNTITTNNLSNQNSLIGQVNSVNDNNTLTIGFPDGSTQTVQPGGLRPLGPGDGVIVSNGVIIG